MFILELQVKAHTSPWFSDSCAAAISYRNHFFRLHQQRKFFPSNTYLKLLNISVTSKVVRKVITNLELWKSPGPSYFLVVVLKNCEPGLSYILVVPEGILFSRLLEGLICGPCIFKNVGLWSNCGLFPDFQYGFKSSQCSALFGVPVVVACICNPATLEAEFQNGVGSVPVGG